MWEATQVAIQLQVYTDNVFLSLSVWTSQASEQKQLPLRTHMTHGLIPCALGLPYFNSLAPWREPRVLAWQLTKFLIQILWGWGICISSELPADTVTAASQTTLRSIGLDQLQG